MRMLRGSVPRVALSRTKGAIYMNSELPTHQIPGVPAEPSQAAARSKGLRGPWLALVVVLAVLAGGLGGYLLRWTVEPTKTVIRTVAPPAYTTSDAIWVTVVFTGDRCAYSGPTEVKAGTQVTFYYYRFNPVVAGLPPEARHTHMAVGPLSPGTTWEDVAIPRYKSTSPPPFLRWAQDFAPGHSWTRRLTEGLWGIWCGTSPTGTNRAFAGTMLRVVGS